MTRRIYLGEPFALDSLLFIQPPSDRPGQHVLVAGEGPSETLSLVVGACASALRETDAKVAASVIACYPTAKTSLSLQELADSSLGRVTYAENNADLVHDSNDGRLLVIVGLDEAEDFFPPPADSLWGETDDDSGPSAGDALQHLLEAGHRTGTTVMATASRPISLRRILRSTGIDPFGFRIAFGMPEDSSNYVLDSGAAAGLDGRAILRRPNGSREQFLPFLAPEQEEIQGFASVKRR